LAKLIVIQLGSNDLGIQKTYELYSDIKLGLLRLKVMCPNARIVWSEILMRRYWHSAQDGRALEKSRKILNLLVSVKRFFTRTDITVPYYTTTNGLYKVSYQQI
jgi:hypothetical protein